MVYVVDLIVVKGGWIDFVDLMIMCEVFKIGLYCVVMIMWIVDLLKFIFDCVSVKVMIIECLGFIGCGEGIVL